MKNIRRQKHSLILGVVLAALSVAATAREKRPEPKEIPDKVLKQSELKLTEPEQIFAFLKDTKPDFIKAFPEIPTDIKKLNDQNRERHVKGQRDSKIRQRESHEKETKRIKAANEKALKDWEARQKKKKKNEKQDNGYDDFESDPKPYPHPLPLEYGSWDSEYKDVPLWHCRLKELYDDKDRFLMSGMRITAIRNFRKVEGTKVQQKKNFRNKWIDTETKYAMYLVDVHWGTNAKPDTYIQSYGCGYPGTDVPYWRIYDPDPPRDGPSPPGFDDNW